MDERKTGTAETIMQLCVRCSGRIAERYYLEPRKGGGTCGLCGREEAKAYCLKPRRPYKKPGESRDTRARWREPWREAN